MIAALLARYLTPALGLALAAALLLAGWQYVRAERAVSTLEHERAQIAAQVAAKVAEARTEEQRRTHKIQEAQDAEVIVRRQAEADARRAFAAGVGLQQQLAVVRAAYVSSHTDAADERASAGEAVAMLADLLGRCSERRRELARFADEAHSAGQLCERAFDSLTPP